jgi:fumarylacetoacetase
MQSWILTPKNTDFPLQNIPFGIASLKADEEEVKFLATIIGDTVISVAALYEMEFFDGLPIDEWAFYDDHLNTFIEQGKEVTSEIRRIIQELFDENNSVLRDNKSVHDQILFDTNEINLHLPVQIGDYTDFYSSRQHATNVGMMFRDPNNALLPNWLHIPVGYHGRASSIVVSGTDIRRPLGQKLPPGAEIPIFGQSNLLDFELEMGFIIGKNNPLGTRITTDEAEDYIFGMVLFNDWSARDIQAWEYVPLGPFLGKNFGSSISAWVVTMEALELARIAGPVQEPKVLPYLEYKKAGHFDVNLEVAIQPESGAELVVSRSNFKNMYWNMQQQLAHHTINGCNMRVGDMCASGTISGDTPDSYGSMLEITWRGAKPITMPDGSERKFINDGDTVIMRGYAQKDGVRIGFGSVEGKVLPAIV